MLQRALVGVVEGLQNYPKKKKTAIRGKRTCNR